jgi:hypothetical protein
VVEDLDLDVRILLSHQLEQKLAEGPSPSSPLQSRSIEVDDESDGKTVRRQRIDIRTDHLPVFLHLDQYRQLLGMIDNYRQRAAAVQHPAGKPQPLPSPRVPAKSASTSSVDPQAASDAQGKGWFSWAWDIMVEEEYCLSPSSSVA